MTEKEIARINFLAKQSRERELTEMEKEEQKLLRKKYVDSVIGSLKSQLDNTKIVNPDGSIEDLKRK